MRQDKQSYFVGKARLYVKSATHLTTSPNHKLQFKSDPLAAISFILFSQRHGDTETENENHDIQFLYAA